MCGEYERCRENIKNGLIRYAIETDENGTRHIIHGWGDKLSYKTASLCDSDGKRRYSVNPNSYCLNEEYHMDGESMGDWFTGSGTVFMRDMVKYAFGVRPTLDGLIIDFPKFIPTDEAELEIKIKGAEVRLVYKNEHRNNRRCFVNGKEQECNAEIFIDKKDLKNMDVSVIIGITD